MKLLLSFFFIFIVLISCTKKDQQENIKNKGVMVMTDYQNVKIKPFPIAVQCWTFRKFTFFETLQKVKDLGITYLEAYPGQMLSSDMPDVQFDQTVQDRLIRNAADVG